MCVLLFRSFTDTTKLAICTVIIVLGAFAATVFTVIYFSGKQ